MEQAQPSSLAELFRYPLLKTIFDCFDEAGVAAPRLALVLPTEPPPPPPAGALSSETTSAASIPPLSLHKHGAKSPNWLVLFLCESAPLHIEQDRISTDAFSVSADVLLATTGVEVAFIIMLVLEALQDQHVMAHMVTKLGGAAALAALMFVSERTSERASEQRVVLVFERLTACCLCVPRCLFFSPSFRLHAAEARADWAFRALTAATVSPADIRAVLTPASCHAWARYVLGLMDSGTMQALGCTLSTDGEHGWRCESCKDLRRRSLRSSGSSGGGASALAGASGDGVAAASAGPAGRVAQLARSERRARSLNLDDDCAQRGWLRKLGGLRGKTWQPRWCVLTTAAHLVYWRTEIDPEPHGCLHLAGSLVTTVDDESVGARVLVLTDGETFVRYFLRGETDADTQTWADVCTRVARDNSHSQAVCPFRKMRRTSVSRLVDSFKGTLLRQRGRPDYASDGAVLREGILYKQGGLLKKAFQARFCVLKPTALYYFVGAQDQDVRGCIALADVERVCATEPQTDHAYCLAITTRQSERLYVLAADTRDERDAWVIAITEAVQQQAAPGAAEPVSPRQGSSAVGTPRSCE